MLYLVANVVVVVVVGEKSDCTYKYSPTSKLHVYTYWAGKNHAMRMVSNIDSVHMHVHLAAGTAVGKFSG